MSIIRNITNLTTLDRENIKLFLKRTVEHIKISNKYIIAFMKFYKILGLNLLTFLIREHNFT